MDNRKVPKKQEGDGLTDIWSASRACRRPSDQARTAVAYISLRKQAHHLISSEEQHSYHVKSNSRMFGLARHPRNSELVSIRPPSTKIVQKLNIPRLPDIRPTQRYSPPTSLLRSQTLQKGPFSRTSKVTVREGYGEGGGWFRAW